MLASVPDLPGVMAYGMKYRNNLGVGYTAYVSNGQGVDFGERDDNSAKAVGVKIQRGVWREGREYRRAPDHNILVDMEGFNRWVEKQPAEASVQKVHA